jgi:RimJ/RimL family protein N-acetyltransferase
MVHDGSLRTSRLELRPIGAGDVDALWPHVSDPELPRLMTWEAHRDRSETAAFVKSAIAAQNEGTGYVWTLRREEDFCGLIGLHDVVRTIRAWRQDRAELGYWCCAAFRNQGLITEAAQAVLYFGFRELGLHKTTVGCATENVPSQRVIEKLGFRLVGEQRDHFFRFDRWWNHLAYEMLVDEWERQCSNNSP